MIRAGGRLILLRAERIDWVEAAGNYVRVHAGGESSLVRRSIGNIDGRLDPRRFLRVSRSAIVNLDSVREVQPLFHGAYQLVLQDGTQLTVSRRLRGRFLRMVGAAQ